MNKKYEQLIADYLSGDLDQPGKREVEELIAKGEIDFMEFRALEELHESLEDISSPKPGEDLRNRFYTMLEEQKELQSPTFFDLLTEKIRNLIAEITLPRLAYTFILLIVGGFIGSQINGNNADIEQLSQEMEAMKEIMMVNMLEGSSAADRLKAVNISAELPRADLEAINALLFTLNNDPSVNVRVQTIEALKRWGDNERVRQGMVRSIGSQESPIVLIELADAMVELEVDASASEFKRILEERDLDYNVEQKLQSSIAVLM